MECSRHFEGGHVSAATFLKESCIDAGSWFGDEKSDRDFTFCRVRRADDGGPGHTRLLTEEFFDFPGVDVEAASDDQLRPTALQCVVAIVGTDGKIACPEKAHPR